MRRVKKHKELLVESLGKYLVPALTRKGFQCDARQIEPDGSKNVGTFPFQQLRRPRPDGGVDLVEIQFKTYGRPAFRINACAVPKGGLPTIMGHRGPNELFAGGLHNHFETHARPWLRPLLRPVGLEPLGEWFSLALWRWRKPTRAAYEGLALRVIPLIDEVDAALREDNVGPHVRRVAFT